LITISELGKDDRSLCTHGEAVSPGARMLLWTSPRRL
jgi:hypothetical protein